MTITFDQALNFATIFAVVGIVLALLVRCYQDKKSARQRQLQNRKK